MSSDVVIDASLFLGMHSTDEATRQSCKAFFAGQLTGFLLMPLEQVGMCDDVVWRFPRPVQDAYYPFMDNVQTDMEFRRFGYSDKDVRAALGMAASTALPMTDRLILAAALTREAVLYTVNPRLRSYGESPQTTRVENFVMTPPSCAEAFFPDSLERLYRTSLALRIAPEDW